MSTFGIRQTFRTQSISRKVARSSPQQNKDEDKDSQKQNNEVEDNIFESQSSFFSNRLNQKGLVQQPNLTPIGSVSSSSSSSSSLSSSSSSSKTDTPTVRDNDKMISARIKLMKNHIRAVTRSEDHM